MKTAVIGVSDTHINSTVALCPPSINLDDGGTYRASRTQHAIGEAWIDFWQEMAALDVERRIVVFAGDLGELDTKRRSTQLITINKANIQEMIIDTLEPALDLADQVIVIRGTKAHTGSNAWLEEAIAKDLDHTIHDNGTASWWHFQRKIENVKFDIAHHQSMGGIPRTEKSFIDRLAYDTIWRYLWEAGEKPPDIIWRAHQHRYVSSGDKWHNDYYKVTAVSLPSWQAPTEWIYRIGQENTRAGVGGVYAICEDGKYTTDKILYRIAPRRIWAKNI